MRYKSCRFLEHGIYFKALDNETCDIKHCCNMDGCPEDEQSFIFRNYLGAPVDWDVFFKVKTELKNEVQKGIYPKACVNCFELVEGDWDDETYISHVTVAHITKCNSRCVYCYVGCDEKLYSASQKFEVMPILTQMLELGILRFDGSIRFMGGEPTLMTDFDDIVTLFAENNVHELSIPTSGIKFSKVLEKAITKIPNSEIFISIDSGFSETYKKIKRIDAYDIVLNSIKRYSEAVINKKFIKSKYIITPGYNDNTYEIDKWISESSKIKLSTIVMDFEYSYVYDENKERYLKHCWKVAEYTRQRVKELGLDLITYLPFYLKGAQILKKNLYSFKNEYNDFENVLHAEKLFIYSDKLILDNNSSENTNEQTADIISKLESSNTIKEISIDLSSSSFEGIKSIVEDLFLKKCLYRNCLISMHSDSEVTNIPYLSDLLYYLYFSGFYIAISTNAEKYSEKIGESLKISDTALTIVPKYRKALFGWVLNNYDSIKDTILEYVKNSAYSGKVNIKYIMKSKNNDKKSCISRVLDFANSVSVNEIIFEIDPSIDKSRSDSLKHFIEAKAIKYKIKAVINNNLVYKAN